MTREERTQRIESYGRAPSQLTQALRQFPKEMWHFKPSPERWSIHEIVVHIADSEANGFVRCRRFIAEPGKPIMPYDQELWAKSLRYSEQSTEDALELFKWLRLTSYKLIRTLREPVWSNTVHHPERGTMTLVDWLQIYEAHVPAHIGQMRKNYEEWKKGVRRHDLSHARALPVR